MVQRIIKRDGSVQRFVPFKIEDAIKKAFASEVEAYDKRVFADVIAQISDRDEISVEAVQDIILIDSRFPFEVRTTVHSDLLRAEEINRIIRDLVRRGYTGTYYLQRFVYTEHTIGRIKPERNAFDAALLDEEIRVVWRT